MKKVLKWLTAVAAVLVVVAGAAVGYAYYLFTKAGPLTTSVIVFVPKGSGLDDIALALRKQKVIDNRLVFTAWVRIYGAHDRLRSGEYRFPRNVSQKHAMRILVEGKQILRRFFVPEGWTTWQIIERLKETPGLVGDITVQPKEGELLPDTYFFARGETRDQLVNRMRTALTRVLAEAWAKRQPDLPFKTKRQALILASIIEKETAQNDERERIAGVFVNRLRKGMRLETDPTVIYGLTNGQGPLGRRLLRKDLRTKHEYNTYVHNGLPPGPIANPGQAAIFAAVNPQKHKELYFVADGTGGHAFAETYREHLENVSKWRKIRRRRNSKR